MNDKQLVKLILSIFSGGNSAEMFSIVNNVSGIRESGFSFVKLEEAPNGNIVYKVVVNKDILERWIGGEK